MAVVRDVGGRARLEYPIGKPLFETSGWIGQTRISPDGDAVAFCHHPAQGDDGGEIMFVDRAGKSRRLAGDFATVQGLAWRPNGSEILFTATPDGANRALYGVTRSGRMRLIARVTGSMTIHDVAPDGRVLITHETSRQGSMGRGPTDEKERSLGWLDFPSPRDLSRDGTLLLFDETGEGGGPGYSVYIRKTDGSPATRLGDGAALAFSPDGQWVLAIRGTSSKPELVLYPTGVGEPRPLPTPGLRIQAVADWMPDGKSLLVTASEPGHGTRLFLMDLAGTKPKAISPEGYRSIRHGVSPDGRVTIARGPDQRSYLYPIAGGEPQPIPETTPQDRIEGWTADGKSVIVHRRGELPSKVYKLDPATAGRSSGRSSCLSTRRGSATSAASSSAATASRTSYGAGWILSDPVPRRGSQVTLAAGTRLGHYEVLALLGAGGMGEVYRARDEKLKRTVAIKVLPASLTQDAERMRRFEQEARRPAA
jgi:Tol biopolymer transport system component